MAPGLEAHFTHRAHPARGVEFNLAALARARARSTRAANMATAQGSRARARLFPPTDAVFFQALLEK